MALSYSGLEGRLRVLNPPLRVLWAGFEANTYALQQAGWELSAEQDFAFRRLRVAFRHRDWKLYAISDAVDWDFLLWATRNSLVELPPLVVRYFVNEIQVLRVPDRVDAFRPVDAQPQFVQQEVRSLEDCGVFATPLVRTEEIIVEPRDVSALLEQIKKLQAPEQAAIRQRERLRAARDGLEREAWPRQRFHAQVISIDSGREAA